MTKKQREQVVELLRCAADEACAIDTLGFIWTATQLELPQGIVSDACHALVDCSGRSGNDWFAACLEAAQRVEEGSWP